MLAPIKEEVSINRELLASSSAIRRNVNNYANETGITNEIKVVPETIRYSL